MRISSGKSKSALIALFLITTMSASVILVQTATAHTPAWNVPSFAYVTAKPDPVGVGQRVMVYMWVDTPMPSAAVSNDIRRHDYKLTITLPSGKTETKDWPIITDTTGIQFYTYIPVEVGTYKLLFEYKGQIYSWSGTYQNDTFAAASATSTLTVQEEQLPAARASYPLPTEYWTRPIEGQNIDWWLVSSNWLNGPQIRTGSTTTGGAGYSRFKPDGIGPNSSHIMWSKSVQDGGVVGGSNVGVEGNTYYMGGSYNVRFSSAIVMYGRLYYQEPEGNSGGGGDFVCVDLRTGEELWRNQAEAGVPSFGYTYAFDDGNQHGVLPEGLLFTNNFARAYDPSTGAVVDMNMTNVPSGTAVLGPKGENLRYVLTTSKQLLQWNSSRVNSAAASLGPVNWYSGKIPANAPTIPAPSGTNLYWNGSQWVTSTVRNAQGYASVTQSAYDWNITLSSLGPGTWSIYRDVIFDNIMLLTQGSFGTGPRSSGNGINVTAVSLKPDSLGQLLWTKYYPPAPNNVTSAIIAIDPDAGTFVTEDKENMKLTGFSLADGSQLWTTVPDIAVWDTMRSVTLSAYGNLYRSGFDGILYCYDMKTGNLEWTYGNGGEGNSTYAGLGTAYGHYPIFVDVINDGKVYLGTTEHSPGSPWYKDVRYRCIDAYTGEEMWTLMGWGTGMYVGQYDIIADGYFVFLNCYDMQIYSVGKGPSAVTVEAPKSAIPLGSSLVISGTVTDIAAGTRQKEQAARFPNGVPAVSDASMGEWMEYVYMQKPRPTDVTGVDVTLSVLDANNNYREIGTTTANSDGFFTFNWKPDIEGQYTVYASFAGSKSYWPSHAVTSFAVDPAVQTQSAEYPQPVDNTMTVVGVGVALLAAIAIVGALILITLRKRP